MQLHCQLLGQGALMRKQVPTNGRYISPTAILIH